METSSVQSFVEYENNVVRLLLVEIPSTAYINIVYDSAGHILIMLILPESEKNKVREKKKIYHSSPRPLGFHSRRSRCSGAAEEGTRSGCHKENFQEDTRSSPQ